MMRTGGSDAKLKTGLSKVSPFERKDRHMDRIWSRPLGVSDPGGPDYMEYFGLRLAERAAIPSGARVLDVGCGTGSSLFPSVEITGARGVVVGIDICPG
jgi:SAM-dependent methyltransferase